MSGNNLSNKDMAKIGVDYIQNAILNVLESYYKEYRTETGIGPADIAKELGIFRGTRSGEDKMKMNDAIISGCLLDLINHKKVEKITNKGKRGQHILSQIEAEKRGLL